MNELYPEQEPIADPLQNSTPSNLQSVPMMQQNAQNPMQIPGQPRPQQPNQQPRGIQEAKQNLQLIIGGFNSMMGLVAGMMNAYLLCTTILKSVLKGVFSVLKKILPISLAKKVYRLLSRGIVGSVLGTVKQSILPSLQTRSEQDIFNNMWEAKPKGLSFKMLTASALKAVLKAAILLSLPLIGTMMLYKYRNRKSAMLREMQNTVRQRQIQESSRSSSFADGYYDERWLGASLGPKSQQTLKDYKLTRVADVMEEPQELLLAQQLEDPSLRYFTPARVSMVTIKESRFFNSGKEEKSEEDRKEMECMGPPNSEEQKNAGERTMFEEWLKTSHNYSGKRE